MLEDFKLKLQAFVASDQQQLQTVEDLFDYLDVTIAEYIYLGKAPVVGYTSQETQL